ncbi:MAG: hypothetical protein ACQESH_06685 [Campylobacterota bacterium]
MKPQIAEVTSTTGIFYMDNGTKEGATVLQNGDKIFLDATVFADVTDPDNSLTLLLENGKTVTLQATQEYRFDAASLADLEKGSTATQEEDTLNETPVALDFLSNDIAFKQINAPIENNNFDTRVGGELPQTDHPFALQAKASQVESPPSHSPAQTPPPPSDDDATHSTGDDTTGSGTPPPPPPGGEDSGGSITDDQIGGGTEPPPPPPPPMGMSSFSMPTGAQTADPYEGTQTTTIDSSTSEEIFALDAGGNINFDTLDITADRIILATDDKSGIEDLSAQQVSSITESSQDGVLHIDGDSDDYVILQEGDWQLSDPEGGYISATDNTTGHEVLIDESVSII